MAQRISWTIDLCNSNVRAFSSTSEAPNSNADCFWSVNEALSCDADCFWFVNEGQSCDADCFWSVIEGLSSNAESFRSINEAQGQSEPAATDLLWRGHRSVHAGPQVHGVQFIAAARLKVDEQLCPVSGGPAEHHVRDDRAAACFPAAEQVGPAAKVRIRTPRAVRRTCDAALRWRQAPGRSSRRWPPIRAFRDGKRLNETNMVAPLLPINAVVLLTVRFIWTYSRKLPANPLNRRITHRLGRSGDSVLSSSWISSGLPLQVLACHQCRS